jgi:hypothetical protein
VADMKRARVEGAGEKRKRKAGKQLEKGSKRNPWRILGSGIQTSRNESELAEPISTYYNNKPEWMSQVFLAGLRSRLAQAQCLPAQRYNRLMW